MSRVILGVRVSSLSKSDSGRKIIDFSAHSLPENGQHKIESFSTSSDTLNNVVTASLDNHSDKQDSNILLICPVCNEPVCDDNDLLNSHIDVCLNQHIIDLEEAPSTPLPKKHRR